MTKDELKKIVTDLQLEQELQDIVFDMIDSAKTVDKSLLDGVANVLNNHAEYLEKTADLFDQAAEEYEDLEADMTIAEADETKETLEALSDNQEDLLEDIAHKVDETQGSAQPVQAPSAQAAELPVTPVEPAQAAPVLDPSASVSQMPAESVPTHSEDQAKLEAMQQELQNITNNPSQTS